MDYVFQAELIDVIDGDTLKVRLDLGFGVHSVQSLRVLGLNCPEVDGPDRAAGLAARDHAAALLRGRRLWVRTLKNANGRDVRSFDRYVCEVGLGDFALDFARAMIADGFGKPAARAW